MSAAPEAAVEPTARRPGRPASDAPERILAAGYEVLARDGYAGLSLAKVAAASGQNKALIAYYFGSRTGLVAAVARRVSQALTDEILGGLEGLKAPRELVEALASGLWRAMDSDPRLQRVYFDLSSQAVIAPEIEAILLEMKDGQRAILRDVLRGLDTGHSGTALDGIAVFIVACLEGLALERLGRGDTASLKRARRHFVDAASALIAAG